MTSYGSPPPPDAEGGQQPPGPQPQSPLGQRQPPQPPPGWQGPQPPQPPPPKKPFYKKWWFIAVAALVVLFAIIRPGSGNDAADTASPGSSASEPAESESAGSEPAAEETTPEVTEDPAPSAPGIGDPVRDGKFEFVVNSVECGLTLIGTADFGVTAQGQFCLVNLSVTNIGNEPQAFFGDNQKLFNEAGQEYSASSEAAIYLPEANSLFQEINPGNQLTGIVVFDIPADAVPVRIELHDSVFSGGVAESVKSTETVAVSSFGVRSRAG